MSQQFRDFSISLSVLTVIIMIKMVDKPLSNTASIPGDNASNNNSDKSSNVAALLLRLYGNWIEWPVIILLRYIPRDLMCHARSGTEERNIGYFALQISAVVATTLLILRLVKLLVSVGNYISNKSARGEAKASFIILQRRLRFTTVSLTILWGGIITVLCINSGEQDRRRMISSFAWLDDFQMLTSLLLLLYIARINGTSATKSGQNTSLSSYLYSKLNSRVSGSIKAAQNWARNDASPQGDKSMKIGTLKSVKKALTATTKILPSLLLKENSPSGKKVKKVGTSAALRSKNSAPGTGLMRTKSRHHDKGNGRRTDSLNHTSNISSLHEREGDSLIVRLVENIEEELFFMSSPGSDFNDPALKSKSDHFQATTSRITALQGSVAPPLPKTKTSTTRVGSRIGSNLSMRSDGGRISSTRVSQGTIDAAYMDAQLAADDEETIRRNLSFKKQLANLMVLTLGSSLFAAALSFVWEGAFRQIATCSLVFSILLVIRATFGYVSWSRSEELGACISYYKGKTIKWFNFCSLTAEILFLCSTPLSSPFIWFVHSSEGVSGLDYLHSFMFDIYNLLRFYVSPTVVSALILTMIYLHMAVSISTAFVHYPRKLLDIVQASGTFLYDIICSILVSVLLKLPECQESSEYRGGTLSMQSSLSASQPRNSSSTPQVLIGFESVRCDGRALHLTASYFTLITVTIVYSYGSYYNSFAKTKATKPRLWDLHGFSALRFNLKAVLTIISSYILPVTTLNKWIICLCSFVVSSSLAYISYTRNPCLGPTGHIINPLRTTLYSYAVGLNISALLSILVHSFIGDSFITTMNALSIVLALFYLLFPFVMAVGIFIKTRKRIINDKESIQEICVKVSKERSYLPIIQRYGESKSKKKSTGAGSEYSPDLYGPVLAININDTVVKDLRGILNDDAQVDGGGCEELVTVYQFMVAASTFREGVATLRKDFKLDIIRTFTALTDILILSAPKNTGGVTSGSVEIQNYCKVLNSIYNVWLSFCTYSRHYRNDLARLVDKQRCCKTSNRLAAMSCDKIAAYHDDDVKLLTQTVHRTYEFLSELHAINDLEDIDITKSKYSVIMSVICPNESLKSMCHEIVVGTALRYKTEVTTDKRRKSIQTRTRVFSADDAEGDVERGTSTDNDNAFRDNGRRQSTISKLTLGLFGNSSPSVSSENEGSSGGGGAVGEATTKRKPMNLSINTEGEAAEGSAGPTSPLGTPLVASMEGLVTPGSRMDNRFKPFDNYDAASPDSIASSATPRLIGSAVRKASSQRVSLGQDSTADAGLASPRFLGAIARKSSKGFSQSTGVLDLKVEMSGIRESRELDAIQERSAIFDSATGHFGDEDNNLDNRASAMVSTRRKSTFKIAQKVGEGASRIASVVATGVKQIGSSIAESVMQERRAPLPETDQIHYGTGDDRSISWIPKSDMYLKPIKSKTEFRFIDAELILWLDPLADTSPSGLERVIRPIAQAYYKAFADESSNGDNDFAFLLMIAIENKNQAALTIEKSFSELCLEEKKPNIFEFIHLEVLPLPLHFCKTDTIGFSSKTEGTTPIRSTMRGSMGEEIEMGKTSASQDFGEFSTKNHILKIMSYLTDMESKAIEVMEKS
jgi:hypothetical protein